MYLVFGYYDYCPSGGLNDLIYMDEDLSKVIGFLASEIDDNIDNFQVVNVGKDIITEGGLVTVTNSLKDYYWDSFKEYLQKSFGYRSW